MLSWFHSDSKLELNYLLEFLVQQLPCRGIKHLRTGIFFIENLRWLVNSITLSRALHAWAVLTAWDQCLNVYLYIIIIITWLWEISNVNLRCQFDCHRDMMLGAIPQERWKKEFFKTYQVFSGYEFYNIFLKFYNIFLFITADTTLPLIL